jgi:hypothetical protein
MKYETRESSAPLLLKSSGLIHLLKQYLLNIKDRKKYRSDEFIIYETDERSAPLHLYVSMPTTAYQCR